MSHNNGEIATDKGLTIEQAQPITAMITKTNEISHLPVEKEQVEEDFYVISDDSDSHQLKQLSSTPNLQFKLILKISHQARPHSVNYMGYAEYDAFRKGIKLAEEMQTLHPAMTRYINHTFDPANIEYMGDALPLPYPTSPTKKRVVFQDKIINKTDEKPSSTIEIKHLLLCLYAGLSNRISQKELNLLGDTKQKVNL